jgi:sugar diacid utilization regulator
VWKRGISMSTFDEFDIKVIETLAECNMNVCKAATKLYCHRNTIEYRIVRIKSVTGLHAKVFYDLCKLLEMIEERTEELDE